MHSGDEHIPLYESVKRGNEMEVLKRGVERNFKDDQFEMMLSLGNGEGGLFTLLAELDGSSRSVYPTVL
eukprot:scaffold2257_cov169-Amphora_coffeaeformis.AAC.14